MSDWFARLPADRLLAEFSLWSGDLLHLGDDLARIAPHADLLHVDVSDGHFAPALLFFPDLVQAVASASRTPVHIHLMCADHILDAQIDQFAEAGAALISIHAENADPAGALRRIRAHGLKTGLVLKLDTPLAEVAPLLPHLDMLTLLGTRVGVKGQGLDPAACDRLAEARALIDAQDRRIVLAADGGIREHTVPDLRRAGADTVVLGSLAFGAEDLAARIDWLHGLG